MYILKSVLAALTVAIIAGMLLLLSGCSALKPAAKYLPGQQYGNSGATPCMNGACPVINQPKSWLKPCGE